MAREGRDREAIPVDHRDLALRPVAVMIDRRHGAAQLAMTDGGRQNALPAPAYAIGLHGFAPAKLGPDRDLAQTDDNLELLGLDHPLLIDLMNRWRAVSPSEIGATARLECPQPSVLTLWLIQGYDRGADSMADLVSIAVDANGKRAPAIENRIAEVFHARPGVTQLNYADRAQLLETAIEPALQRELQHRGIASVERSYASKLLAWIELH